MSFNPLYFLGKTITIIMAKILFGYKTIHKNRVPAKGSFIVASNHISYFDPNLVGAAVPRNCHFFAKRELFKNRLIRWVLKRVNAIPVNRYGFDKESMNTVLGKLESGAGVVIFPEGTRSASGELQPLKPGVGMMAVKSRAPVVPAFIRNSKNPLKNRLTGRKVIVTFAEPILPEFYDSLPTGKEGYRILTGEIYRRMKSLENGGSEKRKQPVRIGK